MAVIAAKPHVALALGKALFYRQLEGGIEAAYADARRTMAEQQSRTLSKSLSCQYRGRLYLIQTGGHPGYTLQGARITVCDDGPATSPVLLHHDKPLP